MFFIVAHSPTYSMWLTDYEAKLNSFALIFYQDEIMHQGFCLHSGFNTFSISPLHDVLALVIELQHGLIYGLSDYRQHGVSASPSSSSSTWCWARPLTFLWMAVKETDNSRPQISVYRVRILLQSFIYNPPLMNRGVCALYRDPHLADTHSYTK